MVEQTKKSPLVAIIIIVVIIGAGVGAYFIFTGSDSSTNTNETANANINQAKNTNQADPYAALMQYDGKEVNISSTDGKVTGKIAFSIDKTQDMPIVVTTFLKVKDDLPKTTSNIGGASYHYIANHVKEADLRKGDSTGVLSAIFCNKDEMPDVLSLAEQRSGTVDTYSGCADKYAVGASTDTFYQIYGSYYNNYTFDYDEILSLDKLAVFDTGPYYERDTNQSFESYAPDTEKAVSEGEIAATYDLVYTE